MKTKVKSKLKALTLAELTTVMVILPFIVLTVYKTVEPKKIKKEAFAKAGKVMYSELVIATTMLAKKYSQCGNLTKIKTPDGTDTFELTDSGAVDNLIALYKKILNWQEKNLL